MIAMEASIEESAGALRKCFFLWVPFGALFFLFPLEILHEQSQSLSYRILHLIYRILICDESVGFIMKLP